MYRQNIDIQIKKNINRDRHKDRQTKGRKTKRYIDKKIYRHKNRYSKCRYSKRQIYRQIDYI